MESLQDMVPHQKAPPFLIIATLIGQDDNKEKLLVRLENALNYLLRPFFTKVGGR